MTNLDIEQFDSLSELFALIDKDNKEEGAEEAADEDEKYAVSFEYEDSTLYVTASVNEAVELGKKYDSPKAAAFINGILGSMIREEKPSS